MIAQDTLNRLPLFTGLAPSALAVLARHGQERRYRTGQALFRAGDVATALIVVLEGRVRVVRSTVARGQVAHSEGRGGTLGEIPLFTGEPYPATATATEPSRCVVVPRRAVESAMAADPALALRAGRPTNYGGGGNAGRYAVVRGRPADAVVSPRRPCG